jgi:hypothetical protein
MGAAPWNPAFIFDYSGGTFDAKRNELVVWGGGHSDYPGNEVYAFSLTTGAWTMLTSRSPYTTSTMDTLADGNPDSRHTYSCIAQVDLPGWDGFFCHGGSLWKDGWPVNSAWFFHRDTLAWEKLPPIPAAGWGLTDYSAASLATFAAFDPAGSQVVVLMKNVCAAFSFTTRSWLFRGNATHCKGGDYEKSAAFDPERRQLVVMGSGSVSGQQGFRVFDVTTAPWTLVRSSALGDQTPVLRRGPGFVFDPVGKQYLAHTGGLGLWRLDRDTWTVTAVAGAGADPGAMYPASGNMGRFRYVPKTHGLVVVNSIDGNVSYHQLAGAVEPTYPLTVAAAGTGSGAVAGEGQYVSGAPVVLTAVPAAGSTFDGWGPSPCAGSFSMPASPLECLATFTLIPPPPPPPPPGIPADTWVAIASPTKLTGAGYVAALYEKHLSLAYSPKTKRLYLHGGDTQKYMVGPGGVTYGGTSYYQGTHSLDLNLRLASPGQVNAGWATEYPFCSSGADVQPKHPDHAGIQWVPWLDKLVVVPGLFYVSNINCPGETPDYAEDPQYIWRKIMSFDIDTKKWAVLSGNSGLISSNAPWHFYADEATRQFVRVLNSGAPLEAAHYDTATDAWTRYRTAGNNLDCTHSHLAVLGRKMYCASRGNGLFGVYDLDAHTASNLGPLPGDPWPSTRVPSDKGYVFAVPQAGKIVYAERLPVGTAQYRVWAWSPAAPTWVRIDTLPRQTLDGEALPPAEMPQGTSGVVDPETGILYLTGCYDCSLKYSWAIRLSGDVVPPPPPPPPTYTLAVAATGTGTGEVTGGGLYVEGAPVTLTATPAEGSTFDGWGPAPCSSSFLMPASSLECLATFTLIPPPPPTYQLTVAAMPGSTGTGEVTGGGLYVEGAPVVLTAVPAAGSTFDGWGPLPCSASFAMPGSSLECLATFTLIPPPPPAVTVTITLPSCALDDPPCVIVDVKYGAAPF